MMRRASTPDDSASGYDERIYRMNAKRIVQIITLTLTLTLAATLAHLRVPPDAHPLKVRAAAHIRLPSRRQPGGRADSVRDADSRPGSGVALMVCIVACADYRSVGE